MRLIFIPKPQILSKFQKFWYQIDEIGSNFENFESALYMKSGSMPLNNQGVKMLR